LYKNSCPLCKTDFTKKDLSINKDLKNEIKTMENKCDCGKLVRLKEWNKHIEACKDYQFNITNEIKSTVVKEVKRYLIK
jgi:hypothetical protein